MNMMKRDLELLGERIAEQAAHLDAALHRLLTDLREFERGGSWFHQGFRSCAQWLSWRVGWSLGTAREHVRVAVRLGELPSIDDALRRGEISYCKVRAMTRVATEANEVTLLEEAKLTTGEQLETICRKYATVQRHDKDVAPRDDEERRYVRRRDTADGMVRIEAVLHPEEAAIVWAALDRSAAERCRERPAQDGRSADEAVAGVDGNATALSSAESSKSPIDELDPELGGMATSVPAGTREIESAAQADPRADGLVSSSHGDFVSTQDSERSRAAQDAPRAGEPVPSLRGGPAATPDLEPGQVRDTSRDGEPSATPYDGNVPAGTGEADPAPVRRIFGVREADAVHDSAPAEARDIAHARARDAARANAQRMRRERFDRADALVSLAQEVIRGTSKDRSPIEVVIAVAAESLRARDGERDPSDVACCTDGTCLSPEAIRRMSCDAAVVKVVEDERGVPLSVGRKTRTIPGSMKRALLRRDRTCRYPGCTTRVFLEGHHIEHWADGGETKLSGLVALCGHHHRFLHEYRYRIELDSSGVAQFFDEQGTRVAHVPGPFRHGELGWGTLAKQNQPLGITPNTGACGWDGAPIDYVACIDELVRSDAVS